MSSVLQNIKGKPPMGVMPAAVWITVPKTLIHRPQRPGHLSQGMQTAQGAWKEEARGERWLPETQEVF